MLASNLYLLSHEIRLEYVVLSEELKHELLLRERNDHIDETDADKSSFSSRHRAQPLLDGPPFLRLFLSRLFGWLFRLFNNWYGLFLFFFASSLLPFQLSVLFNLRLNVEGGSFVCR